MLENELQQLGLNSSESKIYLIALELGSGKDLMMNSPSEIDEKQLKELNIKKGK